MMIFEYQSIDIKIARTFCTRHTLKLKKNNIIVKCKKKQNGLSDRLNHLEISQHQFLIEYLKAIYYHSSVQVDYLKPI